MSLSIKKETEDHSENESEVSGSSETTSTNDKNTNSSETLKRSHSPPHETTKEKTIFIINLPMDWSETAVMKFIHDQCKEVTHIAVTVDEDKNFTGVVRLEFDTVEQCKNAMEIFNRNHVEGHSEPIYAYRECDEGPDLKQENSDDENNEEPVAKKMKKETTDVVEKLTAPDIVDLDPSGLYGLKPEFLKSLDITPPLSKWVHVSNFRCDRLELKEVLELAGRVIMCKVVHNAKKKHARVMYSHPLEAVQAISMLHNQTFYGLQLNVTMESCMAGYLPLPYGLVGVGPGLGTFGKPLEDIPKNFNRYLKEKKSLLDEKIFRTPKEIEDDLKEFIRNKRETDDKNVFSVTSDIPKWVKSKMDEQSRNVSQETDSKSLALRPADSENNDNSNSLHSIQTTSSKNSKYCPSQMPSSSNCGPNPMAPSSFQPAPNFAHHSIQTTSSENSKYCPSQMPSSSNYGPNPMAPSSFQSAPNFAQPNSFVRPNTFPVSNPRHQNMSNCPTHPQTRTPMMQNPQLSVPGAWGPPGPPVARPVPPVVCAGPPMARAGLPMACAGAPTVNVGRPTGPLMPPAKLSPVNLAKGGFTTVKISNLPLSTTFPLLTEKMAHIGPVLSLQLTAPGCAVVEFNHASCADRCYQMYNNANILGNIVKVNYI